MYCIIKCIVQGKQARVSASPVLNVLMLYTIQRVRLVHFLAYLTHFCSYHARNLPRLAFLIWSKNASISPIDILHIWIHQRAVPRLLVKRQSLNVLLPGGRQVYFTASDSMASRYITSQGKQPDHSSPNGRTTLVRHTSGKKCRDCLLYQPHTKLAADFSDVTNLRLFVSPTASGSELGKEKPAGVTVQTLVRYSTAYGTKNKGRK